MAHNQFELLRQRRFAPFFATQAIGAFNDNVYRNAMLAFIAYQIGLSSAQVTVYSNFAPALFILPYFLFSATAGQIAEKYEKSRLIRITTAMEIAIMSVAAVGFMTRQPVVLLVVLFLTGLQSALFGPVKYALLPQVLKPEELTGGNGLVESGTSIAILLGMIAGLSLLLVPDIGPQLAGFAVIGLAIAGHLTSRAIPRLPANAPDLRISWNPWRESIAVLKLTRKQRAVRNAVLGVSWFWFFGTVLTAQLPTYAEVNLGGADPTLYVFALALFSIGVGAGSLLCEKLSARTVEIGLVPLGAFGITVFLLDLYFARSGLAPVSGLGIESFLRQGGSVRLVIDLVGIGLFAGFFVVPLFALIQSRTPHSEMSRVIAGMNIQNAAFIVLAAALGIVVQRYFGWTIPQVFLALGIMNALVALWIFTLVPEFLMRFMSWVLVKVLYRLRTTGIEEHVPDEGAAMIVCNHVSYMDALILAGCIPRPVRFVMYHKIFRIPVMRWIFKTARAIPIAPAKEDAALMARAFDEIRATLAAGDLVGIFPEGRLTPHGDIGEFKRGVERMLEQQPVPVVPMALRGMWTSMWSKRDGRMGRMRVPRRIRAQVELVAGLQVPPELATAAELEARVRALRGDAE